MFARRMLSIIIVLAVICTAGTAFASEGPAADDLSPAVPPYILVTPQNLLQGMTVSQYLLNDAVEVPGAWVGTQKDSDEHASPEALLSTGMQFHYVSDDREKVVTTIVVRGDVLGQGRLTLSQLAALAHLLASPGDFDEYAAAAGDVNGDGKVSLSDLCVLMNALPAELLPPRTDEVVQAMRATDVLNYIPAGIFQTGAGEKWYRPIVGNRQLTLGLPERYQAWLSDAAANLQLSNVDRIETSFETPSWALLAAIASNYRNDPDGMRHALMCAVIIDTSARQEGDGTVLTISAHPVEPETLFYTVLPNPAANAFTLSTSYAYLSTVFDSAMNERRGIGEPPVEPMLFPIANPSRYYVGDCWYLPRDNGARKHTGTDINAPRGTNLLACVDGTIIANGYDPVPGNYIVLQGRDGTQFHYYHMVEPSNVAVGTQVRRGDVIGHVGSTGNSRANHLHMTIITASGQYINPVHYLQNAQTATIRGWIGPS